MRKEQNILRLYCFIDIIISINKHGGILLLFSVKKIRLLALFLIIIFTCGCSSHQMQVVNSTYSPLTESPLTDSPLTESSSAITPTPTMAALNKLISFSLRPEENPLLSSPLIWSVEDNIVFLSVNYSISDDILENAIPFIETSNNSYTIEKMDLTKEQTLTISDEKGLARTYTVVTNRITYNLPVFYIEIEDGKEVTSKEEYLNAKITIDASTASGHFPSLEEKDVLIRGRGHYSWKFPKTPYKIRFENKTSVLGLEPSKNWVLLANYVDRSLMQNHIALEMGKIMENIPYHSSQYPVDVFVNGSYRGVYTFGEQLEAKEERINLVEDYENPDTDYLLELGGTDDGDVFGRDYFNAGTLKFVAIKHPDSTRLSEEQADYLISYVKAADEAVRNLDGYENYIDTDSLIDWFIIHELSYNLDCCFRRSCYLIKEKGGKLKMGPIWDFDLAFGSYFRYEEGDWASEGYSDGYVGVTWMNYLLKDPSFKAKLYTRWNEIKKPLLDCALNCVTNMGSLIAPSAEYNFKVWPTLGESIPSQPDSHRKYNTYSLQIQRLKDFLQSRYTWMDSQISAH